MHMKNHDLIIGNIEEAIEQLQEAVSELHNDQEYDEGQLRQFRHPRKSGTVTVAGKLSLDVPRGTLSTILKQAGLK